jgi:flagellar biosynthetic protein FliR
MPVNFDTIEGFFLVLTRLSVMVFMLPFFNTRVFPALVKAGLSLVLAIILFPVLSMGNSTFPGSLTAFAGLMAVELIVGMTLGLMVMAVFEGVRLMGQVVGFETGFAIANVFDPQSGAQISLLANFAFFVSMTLFLLFNGHHVLIQAMKESFELLPVGSMTMNPALVGQMLAVTSDIFVIALKIGAPAIAALFLTKVAFGLVTKLIPQMNIMIVAFPVQIAVGLFFFSICLTVLLHFMETHVEQLGAFLVGIMNLMAPGAGG